MDQLNPKTITDLWEDHFKDTSFEIIIDDGLHEFRANKIFYEYSIDKLNDDGIYIVEDILNEEKKDKINMMIMPAKDSRMYLSSRSFLSFIIWLFICTP